MKATKKVYFDDVLVRFVLVCVRGLFCVFVFGIRFSFPIVVLASNPSDSDLGRDVVPADHNRAMELYNEAADEATAAGKGKLAMKYYEAIEYLDC
jgi:hypothetical protein